MANLSAVVILFMIVVLGLFGVFFVVPATASDLVSNFVDFRNDLNMIALLLATPIVIGVGVLLVIVVLLGLLHCNPR